MTTLSTDIQPGRWAKGPTEGTFNVACAHCQELYMFTWGQSGPARVGELLHNAGWAVVGRTFGARWYCHKDKCQKAAIDKIVEMQRKR